MKELLDHIISSLLDKGDYEIEESIEEDNVKFTLKIIPEKIGIIIGKGGKTVRSIRNILRIKAVLEKKGVYLEVIEKSS